MSRKKNRKEGKRKKKKRGKKQKKGEEEGKKLLDPQLVELAGLLWRLFL